jgi:hypothetical protein
VCRPTCLLLLLHWLRLNISRCIICTPRPVLDDARRGRGRVGAKERDRPLQPRRQEAVVAGGGRVIPGGLDGAHRYQVVGAIPLRVRGHAVVLQQGADHEAGVGFALGEEGLRAGGVREEVRQAPVGRADPADSCRDGNGPDNVLVQALRNG